MARTDFHYAVGIDPARADRNGDGDGALFATHDNQEARRALFLSLSNDGTEDIDAAEEHARVLARIAYRYAFTGYGAHRPVTRPMDAIVHGNGVGVAVHPGPADGCDFPYCGTA